MQRERLMIYGTPHEVDSMKSLIRFNEQRVKADTTYYIILLSYKQIMLLITPTRALSLAEISIYLTVTLHS